MVIYKSQDFLGPLKFIYENSFFKKFESKLPIDSQALKKLEFKKYTGRDGAFLKSFKVILTNDIITKIVFRWSDNELVMEGW